MKVIKIRYTINNPPRIGGCMGSWWVVKTHVVAFDDPQTDNNNNNNNKHEKQQKSQGIQEFSSESKNSDN